MRTYTLDDKEVEFICSLLAQVPTGQTLQAGMTGLLPKLVQQANNPAPIAPEQGPSA